MKNYEILKLLFKEYGHENVLFVGFDIAKYEHVCMVWNGYKEVQYQFFTFKKVVHSQYLTTFSLI